MQKITQGLIILVWLLANTLLPSQAAPQCNGSASSFGTSQGTIVAATVNVACGETKSVPLTRSVNTLLNTQSAGDCACFQFSATGGANGPATTGSLRTFIDDSTTGVNSFLVFENVNAGTASCTGVPTATAVNGASPPPPIETFNGDGISSNPLHFQRSVSSNDYNIQVDSNNIPTALNNLVCGCMFFEATQDNPPAFTQELEVFATNSCTTNQCTDSTDNDGDGETDSADLCCALGNSESPAGAPVAVIDAPVSIGDQNLITATKNSSQNCTNFRWEYNDAIIGSNVNPLQFATNVSGTLKLVCENCNKESNTTTVAITVPSLSPPFGGGPSVGGGGDDGSNLPEGDDENPEGDEGNENGDNNDDPNGDEDDGGDDGDEGSEGDKDEPIEDPEEDAKCPGTFTSNGLQPVAGPFQDDDSFRKHTRIKDPKVVNFGETLLLAVDQDKPKDIVNNRLTLAMPRNPDYKKLKDLTKLNFSGKTTFTKNVPLTLVITAEDSSGQKLNYTHKKTVMAPFGGPCGPEKDFNISFNLKDLLKKKPDPKPFRFTNAGDASITAIVNRKKGLACMAAKTEFNVADTSIGEIMIIPVIKFEPDPDKAKDFRKTVERKHKQSFMIAKAISERLPDYYPLPNQALASSLGLDFYVLFPKHQELDSDAKTADKQRDENRSILSQALGVTMKFNEDLKNSAITIALSDKETLPLLLGGAEAYAQVGSIAKPGLVVIQDIGERKKDPDLIDTTALDIRSRFEDAAHEITHALGFDSTASECDPPVHTTPTSKVVEPTADGCQVTVKSKVKNTCFLNKPPLLGTGINTRITQCVYDLLIDKLKAIAGFKKKSKRPLISFDTQESLLIKFLINLEDETSIELLPAYDIATNPDSFFEEGEDPSHWHLDLRDSNNDSLQKLFFAFNPNNPTSDFVEKPISQVFRDFTIPNLSGLASVAIIDADGNELAALSLAAQKPSLLITSVEPVLTSKQQVKREGKRISVSWEANDPADLDLKYTVLLGSSADSLVIHGGAFEISDTSVELAGLTDDIKFIQVLATNGSRSAESDVLEF